MKLRDLLLVCLVMCLATACATHHDQAVSGQGARRVFNPITKEWEWRHPGGTSTSPGASQTSGQAYP